MPRNSTSTLKVKKNLKVHQDVNEKSTNYKYYKNVRRRLDKEAAILLIAYSVSGSGKSFASN